MSRKKTNEEFISELKIKSSNSLKSLSDYIDTKTKVRILCNICNHEFKAKPLHLLGKNPTGCPECAKKKRKQKQSLTKDDIISKVFELVGNEYEIIDWMNFKGTRSKVMFRHNECGNEFPMMLNNFLNKGQRCPEHRFENNEYQFKSKSHDHYMDRIINECVDYDEYTFLSDFTGYNIKSKIRHNKCGHEYEVTPGKFLQGRRCPLCASHHTSNPIRFIVKLLEDNNIDYKLEKTFDDLINPKTLYKLRFDIYLTKYNCIIEYDGEFHDMVIKNRTTEEDLLDQKYRDEIKNKYCLDNNIPLLRIHYTDRNNIKDIILNFIEVQRLSKPHQ